MMWKCYRFSPNMPLSAIENARRYEKEHLQTERLAHIARIGHMLTADLNTDQLLEHAANAIHELLGYPNVGIPLLDPEDPNTLVLRVFGGHYRTIMEPEYRLSIHTGIMGAAVRERAVQMVNDVHADPRHLPTPGAVGIIAEIALPILLGNRVFGVLNVESDTQFTEEDRAGLQVLADQLAVAIENTRLFTHTQRALGEMQFLYDTSRRISTAMDIDQILDAYSEQVSAHSEYECRIALFETDAQGRKRTMRIRGNVGNAGRFTPGEELLPYTLTPLDRMLDQGETVTIVEVEADPRVPSELRTLLQHSQQRAVALIPLMARGLCNGIVILSHPDVHLWRAADLRPYQATAAHLATVLHSRSQYLQLSERGQQIAVLEERQRLARELHDSVTQLLFSITLIAQSIGPAWSRDREEGERRVERLLELSQNALAEMRALLSNLRPQEYSGAPSPALPAGILAARQYGLATALRLHAAGVAREGIEISADTREYTTQPLEVEETLFRIMQEALNNVVKHARAEHVHIQLRSDTTQIVLTMRDDGIGFSIPTANAQTGEAKRMGLGIMRERAEAHGGRVHLTSSPGNGTTMEAVLPTSTGESL